MAELKAAPLFGSVRLQRLARGYYGADTCLPRSIRIRRVRRVAAAAATAAAAAAAAAAPATAPAAAAAAAAAAATAAAAAAAVFSASSPFSESLPAATPRRCTCIHGVHASTAFRADEEPVVDGVVAEKFASPRALPFDRFPSTGKGRHSSADVPGAGAGAGADKGASDTRHAYGVSAAFK